MTTKLITMFKKFTPTSLGHSLTSWSFVGSNRKKVFRSEKITICFLPTIGTFTSFLLKMLTITEEEEIRSDMFSLFLKVIVTIKGTFKCS